MNEREEKIKEILSVESDKKTLQEMYAASKFDFAKRPLSYSRLKHMLTSPLHFAFNWFEPFYETEALIFGRLVDVLLFTPDDYDKQFVIMSKFSGTGSVKAREQWKENNVGKSFIEEDDVERAKAIVEAVKTNKKTSWLWESTTSTQEKVYWTDQKTGLRCVMVLDARATKDDKPVIWDFKTSIDASKEEYPRQAVKFDYPLQAGTYIIGDTMDKRVKGIEVVYPDFYQIVAEKTEPFAVNTFRASNDFIELGKNQFRTAMDRVKFCIDNDCFWMGYEFLDMIGYDEMDLPGWMKQKR